MTVQLGLIAKAGTALPNDCEFFPGGEEKVQNSCQGFVDAFMARRGTE